MKGVYGLVVEGHGQTSVGQLGMVSFDGVYVYVGSAQGPGGLPGRIERHHDVALEVKRTRHWHIDYLLGSGEWIGAYGAETADPGAECALARELGRHVEQAHIGFGASDCRCASHLFRIPARDPVPLLNAFGALELSARPF